MTELEAVTMSVITVVKAIGPDSNRQAAVTLARHYATSPERVELLDGYANPQKSFRLIVPA